jgi:hypothetical protein
MAREKKDSPVSVRLTPTAARLWEDLAGRWGQSKAAVLERLLREAARTEGIPEDGARTAETGISSAA